MKRGIIWICWYATSGLEEDHSGRNRVMDRQIKQLEYSVKWARMEGYPVNVFIEKPHEMGWVLGCTRYYDDLYNFLNEDEITFYDYPDKYHFKLLQIVPDGLFGEFKIKIKFFFFPKVFNLFSSSFAVGNQLFFLDVSSQ